jgi:hypothetical protein
LAGLPPTHDPSNYLNQPFDTVSSGNALFNDGHLAVIVAQAKSTMVGVEANDLRTDADLGIIAFWF